MKSLDDLKLTGIAMEQSFSREQQHDTDRYGKLGPARYFLVFNNGELRLPVPEATATELVKFVYGEDMPAGAVDQSEDPSERLADEHSGAGDEETVVPQRYEEDTDEDGVSSI